MIVITYLKWSVITYACIAPIVMDIFARITLKLTVKDQ